MHLLRLNRQGFAKCQVDSRPALRCTVRCATATASHQADDADVETAVRGGWDPEGLLGPPTAISTNHFERRQRQKQAAAGAMPGAIQLTTTQLSPSATDGQPAPPPTSSAAALPQTQPKSQPVTATRIATLGSQERQQIGIAQQNFVPLKLDFPGLHMLHSDPPIFLVENFFTPEQCNSLICEADASGALEASKIGAGNASVSGGNNTYNSRRTSRSLLVEDSIRVKYPAISEAIDALQAKAMTLFDNGATGSWGRPGRMPNPGQYCFESPQVACYERGQHFLAHEDAFPVETAASNGFNRHATLLLYLNDVPQGGATHFDKLGLSVQPRQGTALLFFPSFADGTPDARSLHTAQDAVDTKWVSQQWVARGFVPRRAAAAAAAARVPTPLPGPKVKRIEVDLDKLGAGSPSTEKKRKGKKQGDGRKSGFGK